LAQLLLITGCEIQFIQGLLVWNRIDRTGEKVIHKELAGVIFTPNSHEALVTTTDFEQVQKLITDRRPSITHPRTVSSPYILSGFSFCEKMWFSFGWYFGKVRTVFLL